MTIFCFIQNIVDNNPSEIIILVFRVVFKSTERIFVLALCPVPCVLFPDFHPIQHVQEHLPQPGRFVGLRRCKVRLCRRQPAVLNQRPDPVHNLPEQFCNPLQNCFFLLCGVAAFVLQPVQKVVCAFFAAEQARRRLGRELFQRVRHGEAFVVLVIDVVDLLHISDSAEAASFC